MMIDAAYVIGIVFFFAMSLLHTIAWERI